MSNVAREVQNVETVLGSGERLVLYYVVAQVTDHGVQELDDDVLEMSQEKRLSIRLCFLYI